MQDGGEVVLGGGGLKEGEGVAEQREAVRVLVGVLELTLRELEVF